MERYRTGPFHPTPHIYESLAHDELDTVFGLDLRRWAALAGHENNQLVPPVFSVLLNGLQEAYDGLSNDTERRKAWIYEVPLSTVHHAREALDAVHPDQPFPPDILKQYDAPVIASTIKLWLLELDPPLALWEGWQEFRKLYPKGMFFKNYY